MNATIPDPRWKDLYQIGGIAAIVSELALILGIAIYPILPFAPGSKSTEEIFLLLHSNPLGGLISLDLFLCVANLLGITLYLALYISLKSVNESYALIALALGLIGVVLLIVARPLFEMYSLSGLYASATTSSAKSQYLAAGEALLAQFQGLMLRVLPQVSLPGVTRVSLGIENSEEDVDALIDTLGEIARQARTRTDGRPNVQAQMTDFARTAAQRVYAQGEEH